MSGSKQFEKIAWSVTAWMLILTLLFMNGRELGLESAAHTIGYEDRLFDNTRVHSIDIVMDDWEDLIANATSEEYYTANVIIDGESLKNIGIRAKGNSSLSTVASLGSERYSFKIEFDHYDSSKSYYGLDKLSLNNLIQDSTMMKDYLTYTMMNEFGVDSSLCSYVYITVNGEGWGLYLAVEGVEDAFLERNYGSDAGELYKPDSMSFGGGRGNGRDFHMEDFELPDGEEGMMPPGQNGEQPELPDGEEGMMPPGQDGERPELPDGERRMQPGDAPGGMGSDDVKLKYIDEDPDSYSNIFENAKTDISDADQERLIASLKSLNSYSDLEECVNTDEVLRYFVVHNFVCNGDSYTGSMIHNYYLYEQEGQFSMIPWDYNLAFGTFQGNNASDAVNESIDNPVSGGDVDDRPMLGWIFSQETYTDEYHKLFEEFLERWFTDGELEEKIVQTAELIRPYVEKDPTKFCTTEEFEEGVEAITEFVTLRAEAVDRQLAGDDTPVDTEGLVLSDMGIMQNDRR